MMSNIHISTISYAALAIVILGTLLLIGIAGDSLANDAKEDRARQEQALALLQGVEEARAGVSSGRMEIDTGYHTTSNKNDGIVALVYDGGQRRVEVLTGKTKGAKTILNDRDVICFDGDNSCTVSDPDDDALGYCFDPRILGISVSYRHSETVESRLPYRKAKSIRLIGQEVLPLGKDETRGVTTWHVQVVDAYDQQLDYWIEEAQGFPVHKYQFQVLGGTRRTVAISRYDPAVMPASLPVDVECTTYAEQDRILDRVTMRVRGARFGERFGAESFDLLSLQLPVGTPVADLRLKKRIGYWDGGGLVPLLPVRKTTSTQEWNFLGWPTYLAGVICFIAVLFFVAWRWLLRRQVRRLA